MPTTASAAEAAPSAMPPGQPDPGPLDLEGRRNVVDKETIEKALTAAKGNKSLTARLLKISRNGLAARMKALGIRE